MDKAKAFSDMSVLFDFDGTIGDTETPAMEVAFWELAPYLAETSKSTPFCKDALTDTAVVIGGRCANFNRCTYSSSTTE